jgi:hypothetical protein
MWDLWWTKWHWCRFSPSASVSPPNSHSTDCWYSRSSTGWRKTSGLNLTLAKEITISVGYPEIFVVLLSPYRQIPGQHVYWTLLRTSKFFPTHLPSSPSAPANKCKVLVHDWRAIQGNMLVGKTWLERKVEGVDPWDIFPWRQYAHRQFMCHLLFKFT